MNSGSNSLSIIPITGIPEIKPGDQLVKIAVDTVYGHDLSIHNGDIIVFAQKIISKAEGRIVNLRDISPSPFAVSTARELDKEDPRIIELVLRETKRIVKMGRGKLHKGRLIAETRSGVICANAGVDESNVSGGEAVTLLPINPDAYAKEFVEGFKEELGVDVAVIITDTVGRPWREGIIEIAIGCWGMKPLRDYRGEKDSTGYELRATLIAVADELAGAAGLVMGKNDAIPVVIIRGYKYEYGGRGARELTRNPQDDLFG